MSKVDGLELSVNTYPSFNYTNLFSKIAPFFWLHPNSTSLIVVFYLYRRSSFDPLKPSTFFHFETVYFQSLRTFTLSLFNRLFWLFGPFIFDFRTIHFKILEPQRVFVPFTFSLVAQKFWVAHFHPLVMSSCVLLYRSCFVSIELSNLYWPFQYNWFFLS